MQFSCLFLPLSSFLLVPFPGSTYGLVTVAPASSAVCANLGRFLHSYCVADYNCNGGNPQSNQVCIRGRCCTRGRIRKQRANTRTLEDNDCPAGSYNVGLTCQSDRDCTQKADQTVARRQMTPIPLLECARQRTCCTTSNYRKPLQRNAHCLNGGRAIGSICNQASDCQMRTQQGRRLECVDEECCTPQGQTLQQGGEDDLDSLDGLEAGNGNGRFRDDDTYESEEDLLGEEEDDQNDLQRGRLVCRRNGLSYRRSMHCSATRKCANSARFRCIQGFCCERSNTNAYNNDDSRLETEFGWTLVRDWQGNVVGRIPQGVAGFCVGTGQYRRFMGQTCRIQRQCQQVPDEGRTRADVRCLRGLCCAAMGKPRAGQWDDGGDTNGDGMGTGRGQGGGLIPVRPTGANAFCYDGTISHRQCVSDQDCSSDALVCVNQLCCPTSLDAQQYACGGLAGAGQCNAAAIPGTCSHGRLHCNPPGGVCCECRQGQMQPNMRNCNRRGAARCADGYECDRVTGFCCPLCPDGGAPFGSCHLGRCASGFVCQKGNICCQSDGQPAGTDLDGFGSAGLPGRRRNFSP